MKSFTPYFKTLVYTLLIGMIPAGLYAKGKANTITDSKTVTKTFTVNAGAELNLNSREADVVISTWSENKIEATVTLTVEAYDREELDKMLNEMKISMIGDANNVSIKNEMTVKTQVTTGNKTRIKTETQSIKIKSYRFKYEIKMPATNHLNLKNHYGKVQLGSHTGRLNLELHETKLMAEKISSPASTINLRYTKATLGPIKELNLKTYESKVTLGEIGQLKLEAKYSSILTTRVMDVTLSAYESKIDLGITNQVRGQHNYGNLKIAEAKKVVLKTYELELEAGQIEELNLEDSKYSKVTCGTIDNLIITKAYENKMTFGTVNTVSGNAKYCKLDIGLLKQSMEVTCYEVDCHIEELARDFSKLAFYGKYSKANIQMLSETGYQLEADIQHGSVSYPRDNFKEVKLDTEGSHMVVAGQVKGYSGKSLISIKGYELAVSLAYR